MDELLNRLQALAEDARAVAGLARSFEDDDGLSISVQVAAGTIVSYWSEAADDAEASVRLLTAALNPPD